MPLVVFPTIRFHIRRHSYSFFSFFLIHLRCTIIHIYQHHILLIFFNLHDTLTLTFFLTSTYYHRLPRFPSLTVSLLNDVIFLIYKFLLPSISCFIISIFLPKIDLNITRQHRHTKMKNANHLLFNHTIEDSLQLSSE